MEQSINLNELTFSERDRYIIITNAYPHEEQLYRNGFIHRRVKAYLDEGLKVDVFVLHPAYKKAEKYTYEDVPVYRGTEQHLRIFLNHKVHKKHSFILLIQKWYKR